MSPDIFRSHDSKPMSATKRIKSLMVPLTILPGDAFVITAFFTDEVKGGSEIWPK
jgi:hypothetical protein